MILDKVLYLCIVIGHAAAMRPSGQAFRQLSMRGSAADWSRFTSRHASRIEHLEGGKCSGITAKVCNPCPAGENNNCEDVGKQCQRSLCNPLCLGDALFSCEIVGKKGFQVNSAESAALCAQIRGWACSEKFDCCKAAEKEPELEKPGPSVDDPLTSWVVNQAGKGATQSAWPTLLARPPLPIGQCTRDRLDKSASERTCTECQARLEARMRLNEDGCKAFMPPGADPAEESSGAALALMHERCMAMVTELGGKVGQVLSEANKWLCGCAGCCEGKGAKEDAPDFGECPFPVFGIT